MAKATAKNLTEVQRLSSILSATLNEGIFFGELSRHLATVVKADRVLVFRALENAAPKMVSMNFKASSLEIESGLAAYVMKSKRAYFSNSVERDPLLGSEAKAGVKSEIAIPVAHEGIVIATMHFQMMEEGTEYGRQDVTNIASVLNELKTPIANMKMYLSAMALNEALMRQIQEQQAELETKGPGLVLSNDYKIEEKEIVTRSEAMSDLLALADKAALTNANVLIEGEVGTGKEMIARRIHCRSERAERSFIVVDCAKDENVLMEEIFGACENEGAIERANGGTLVLRNIEKLNVNSQASLAQYLKEGVAVRCNSTTPFRADVKIIATSNDSLIEKIEEGTFRDDLYFSLNTVSLDVPALRSRIEDIEVLAHHFLNIGKASDLMKSIAPSALRILAEYSWASNVRELRSVMERAYILADGMIIDENHLPEQVLEGKIEEEVEVEEEVYTFSEMTLNDLEKQHICKTLDFLSGNKTRTAKNLGITVKTLYNKLHSYGMIMPKEA